MRRIIIGLVSLLVVQTALTQTSRFRGADKEKDKKPKFNVLSKEKRKQLAKAQPEDITNENFPDLIESFDYPNADLADLVKAMSELTGKNFIIEPGFRGKITIIAPTQITVAEAYRAFLSALAINGLTIVPSGKFLKIKQSRQAQRDAIETYSGAYFPNTDQMITRIVHLKHISAGELQKQIRNLATKDGEISPYESTNSLIISDYGSNIERIVKIIRELDRPGFEEKVVVITVRYAKAKDLADIIDKIINKGETSKKGSRISRFRSRGKGAKGGKPEQLSLVQADDRTNALIVVGNDTGIMKVRKLVRTLDYRLSPDEAGGVFVYYVKNVEAKKIADTLSGLAKEAASKQQKTTTSKAPSATKPVAKTTEPIFGGDVKITADENTNSLIITASKQDYLVVKNLLAKIDIPKDQVFVEAIIMEMNVGGGKDWGITYYRFDKESKGIGRAGFSSGSLTNLINPINDKGAILGFGSGESFEFTTPAGNITIKTLLGFVNFVRTHTESNVLSTPRILALDNEEATIEVGDEVPVGNETSTTGSTATTSITFKKATIKLKIKPFISRTDDTVRMTVDQTIKQVSDKPVQAQNLAQNAISLTDRSLQTSIVVRDGDTAVLGGLMRDQESVRETKVPILGDIPILGWLFKGRNTSVEKLNLVIFLTPKVIRNPADSHEILDYTLDERLKFLQKHMKGRDPYGEKIDEMPRTSKTGPPASGADSEFGVDDDLDEEIEAF